MLSGIIALIAVVVLVAADQLIKAAVVANMDYHQSIPVIENVLNWTYTTNTGGGFSILSGKTAFLVIITVLVMGVLIALYLKGFFDHWTGRLSAVLIVAGGIGNMIDRVFNDGHVVDYIDISPLFNFAIFNFADCCVTVGGVLLCFYILFRHDKKQDENIAEATDGDNQD